MAFHGIQRSSEWFATLLFGKIHNIDVLQSKSPIKMAVKSGAKFVEDLPLITTFFILSLAS